MDWPATPNTLFRTTEADPRLSGLLHGTCGGSLSEILRSGGLQPRGLRGGRSNWPQPSHEGAVYLTSAYALHYAACAMQGGLAAILDVDVAQLQASQLVADEDSYALAGVQGLEALQRLPLPDRVAYWRAHLHTTDASESLRVLGNCAYLGTVAVKAIRSVRLLKQQEVVRLVTGVSDPAITPTNFKLEGGTCQRFCAWLAGRQKPEDADLTSWFEWVCRPSLPLMSLAEAAAWVESHQ